MGDVIYWPHYVISLQRVFGGHRLHDRSYNSEESKRNRPYFHHIISEQLAIEKTICNQKKIVAHANELVCFRKSHQTWRFNVY